ncbi:MAG: peptidylprolyl isomerase [Isosphaeraceae bacterium]
MKRQIGVGLLCLALAGCSQTRQSKPEQAAHGQPINMDPVPSLSQTINRGMGDPAIQKATLPDAKSPMWYGQYAPPPGESSRASSSGRAGGALAATPAPGPASSRSASEVLPSPSSPVPASVSPADPASAVETAAPAAAAPTPPVQTVTPRQPGSEDPAAGAPASPGSVPGPSSAALSASASAPAPAPTAVPTPAGELLNSHSLPPVQEPQLAADAAGRSPQASAASADTAPAASAPSAGTDAAGGSSVADRLLGPNPDLMPALDAPVTRASQVDRTMSKPRTRDAAAKPAVPAAAGEMPLETSPELPTDPQPAKGALTPQSAAGPDTKNETDPVGSPSASAAGPAGSNSKINPEVRPAMFNPAALSDEDLARNWRQAGRAAARVGDEVITLHDLVLSVKEQLSRHPAGRDLSPQELNFVAKTVLAGLIERTLVVQEAKRALKNPKQLDSLYSAADGFWRERELPPLLRRYMADNENQLKQKFKESGRSLEAARQNYRQDFLAQVYMDQKLSGQSKVELPEMLRYYNEHLHDKEFDRPAMITWRELVVEKSQHPNEAAARSKAEDLLARLNKGEAFAALARTQSEGPSSVRAQGGLMQTSPGSYAVDAVNQALESLPLNQNSAILEGPTSLHIVRVENRRAAGPASFEEIQDQIRQRVQVEKMRSSREQFIKKLKRDTLVSTIFDGTESDPSAPEKE